MSLDIYLRNATTASPRSGIFIRRDGRNVEITREEWDRLQPGVEPVILDFVPAIFSTNITHNLTGMARAAGLYIAMWRPEEIGATVARDVIGPLISGLAALLAEPDGFKALNPSNGWGSYETLVDVAQEYLAACINNPDAAIKVRR